MTTVKKLSVYFVIVVGICSLLLAQAQMQTERNDIQTQQPERQMQILKGDYNVARQALNEAVIEKDKAAVKIALKQRRFGPAFQSDAVNAAKQINDKEFVPDLIEILEKNQNIAWRGGNEVKFQQKELNKTIISTLEIFTELNFGISENLTPQEIEKVLQLSREWQKTSEAKIKQQEAPILSKEFTIAEKALEKAIIENDKETLRIGLKNQILSIKKKVVDALSDKGYKDVIPDLIDTLKRNQIQMRGGTEARFLQRDLDKSILKALEKLTELEFKVSDSPSAEEIKEVINQSQEWYKKHEAKISNKQ